MNSTDFDRWLSTSPTGLSPMGDGRRLLVKGFDDDGWAYTDFEYRFPLLAKSQGVEYNDDDMRVCGLASCEDPDLQGEELIQKGMDLSPCIDSGVINWDHMTTPDCCFIGWPTTLDVVRIENHPRLNKSGLHGWGLYAEGRLLKGHPMAQWVWSLIKAIEANAAPRKIAYSVQGRVYERDGGRLTKSELRHLALTHQPVQQKSFVEVLKSVAAMQHRGLLSKTLDTAGATPLMLENLDPKMTSVLWGVCERGCFNSQGRFHKGRSGMLEHMSKCHGRGVKESAAFLKALITSGLISR